jgi:hypothetical protein
MYLLTIRISIRAFLQIDITFPGNKKVSGNPGDSLKALAAKAKANINYGCEEGKDPPHMSCG